MYLTLTFASKRITKGTNVKDTYDLYIEQSKWIFIY